MGLEDVLSSRVEHQDTIPETVDLAGLICPADVPPTPILLY